MKPLLMYLDRDFDPEAKLPWNADALVQDLGLDAVFDAMAGKDDFLRGTSERAMLLSLGQPDVILYRQAILRDCLENPAVIREMYDLAVEAIA